MSARMLVCAEQICFVSIQRCFLVAYSTFVGMNSNKAHLLKAYSLCTVWISLEIRSKSDSELDL